MKKLMNFQGISIMIALLVMMISFTSCDSSCQSSQEKAQIIEQNNAIASQKLKAEKLAETEKARADSLQAALDNCCPKPKILSIEEKIEILWRNQKTPSQPSSMRVRVRRSYTPKVTDVPEKSFSGSGSFTPEVTRSSSVTVETFSGDNGTLSTTLYEGGQDGDYFTTINDAGHLVYFLKGSIFASIHPDIPAPRLNGENGPEFTFDQASGFWFCIDGRLISVQEINNYKYAQEWNIYAGMTNYGSGSYPTYIPHQMVKFLLNKVRGKEWGDITDDDLYKMRIENPNIWTPTQEGTLKPFRLNSTDGRALGKEDRNMYQGWNFRTRIYAKRKITTTGSLIYKIPKTEDVKNIYTTTGNYALKV